MGLAMDHGRHGLSSSTPASSGISLAGIKRTNTMLQRGKSILPSGAAAAASVAASSSGMAAPAAPSRSGSLFGAPRPPSGAPAAAAGTSKLVNFDEFNQELKRRADVSLLRAGSFLQRSTSTVGALLKRGLSDILATAEGAAASGAATDFSSMFAAGGSSAAEGAPAASAVAANPHKPLSSSAGGKFGRGLGKAAAQKAFVFRKATAAEASRDGFENSLPGNSLSRSGTAGASASAAAGASGAAAPAAATSFSGLSGFLQRQPSVAGAASGLSTSAPLAGLKRQHSSGGASRSGYEGDEASSGGTGSALLNRLKKAKV